VPKLCQNPSAASPRRSSETGHIGTVIKGVKATGDLIGKHANLVFDLYNTLTTSSSLLPPAIGSVFDDEGRSQSEKKDLLRRSKGLLQFLPRRMYENFLALTERLIERAPAESKDITDILRSALNLK
jgi:hypothetical protein